MIRKKRFEELKDPILTLKEIRNIDSYIYMKTTDEYAKLINKIEVEITSNIGEVLDNSIKKLNMGKLEP